MQRLVCCPGIYKHFKAELETSTRPNEYRYATMFISKPKKSLKDIDKTTMKVYSTEQDKEISIFLVGNEYFHHIEDCNEEMIIYTSLYDGHIPYARPYSMFISEVDHIKYPNIKQKYRFELIAGGIDKW